MGGRNSMAFTAQYPERVEKLVIVDIGPVVDPTGARRLTQEIKEVPEEFDSFEELVAYMSKQNRFASDAVLRRRLQYASKELADGKLGWRYDLAVREQRRQGTGAPAADLWPAMGRISCPTLIVRGAETDLLSTETAQRMIDSLPQGRLVEVPRAGHMVFEDNPQSFMAVVRDFLG
jgi:pimeloyl-ACP methyl ester carboxylesterase